MKRRIKVLNLYAGLGGNRKLWKRCHVTAVEWNPQIADVYQRLFPEDSVKVTDAHQWLLEGLQDYDFIWSSPPCQTHSRMALATRHALRRYPDMKLYEEILFLRTYAKDIPWAVENVKPYYKPLIEPQLEVGRHLFWCNFPTPKIKDVERPSNFINRCNVAGKKAMMEWLGIHYPENIYIKGNHCPAQILRNCVHPEVGLQIFEAAIGSVN